MQTPAWCWKMNQLGHIVVKDKTEMSPGRPTHKLTRNCGTRFEQMRRMTVDRLLLCLAAGAN